MEKVGTWDKEGVISELTQGMEFANQLQKELNNTTATSREACVLLLEKILSSYDNASTLLSCMGLLGNGEHPSNISVFNIPESPFSFEGNHSNEASDPDSKDQQAHVSKKRKTLRKRSEQVRVCCGTGVEDDGYNWRKYGQKDIQGANHPRSYFRCTHRHAQGCLATKQVQQTDDCPSIFDVIYIGKHTCMQQMRKHNHDIDVQKKEEEEEEESTKTGVKVETQEKHNNEDIFLDFSLPCTTPVAFVERSYSPPFLLSPATSESYFSLSLIQVNDFGIGQNLPCSESGFTEIISNPSPIADFTTGDLDSLIGLVDFDYHLLEDFDCF